jgi:hypothetical protein
VAPRRETGPEQSPPPAARRRCHDFSRATRRQAFTPSRTLMRLRPTGCYYANGERRLHRRLARRGPAAAGRLIAAAGRR